MSLDTRVELIGEDGLQVIREDDILGSVNWVDIKKIIVYKYDNFTTDEICVGLLTALDADSWLEISEECSGFMEAVEKMREVFPSIPEDWYIEVMVPVFERKETVLWQEKPGKE